MIFKEEKRDLFRVNKKYYLAHCISSDCVMGAGIAVQFQKKFNLRDKLLRYNEDTIEHPTCIRIGRVFNLITKEKYWHKPTYGSLEVALILMKEIALDNDIKYIAMPKIGSGLDRLQWAKVKEIIKNIFDDTDIEILVCQL